MRDSAICRLAAMRIDREDYSLSCSAIYAEDTRQNTYFLVKDYAELFSPHERRASPYWLGGRFQGITRAEQAKQWRVLALLFFAEILVSEGR